MVLELIACTVAILIMIVLLMGFMYYDEWEIGIEFLPMGYNSFELGISNRNYNLYDEGQEQELRIGVLLFTFTFLFRRFDA